MRLRSLYTFVLLQIVTTSSEAQKSDSLYVLNGTISYGFNRFNDRSRFRETDSTVIFFLRNYNKAKKVFLSGNFCNWSPDKWAMKKTDSGWTVEIKLNTGKYWYKFVIDDNWKLDPDNMLVERDQGGYINSMFYKTNAQFRLSSYNNAKKVFLTGSFNNWRPDELKMIRTKSGWQFPLYLIRGSYAYQFIVDGNKVADHKNEDGVKGINGQFKSIIHIDDFYKDLYGWNEFKNSKFSVRDSVVQFFLRDRAAAKQVFLSGSFVNWQNPLAMVKTDSGWIVNVKLAPGKYWYKFIVDGIWLPDPDNLLTENNSAEAHTNSLYYKTNVLFRFSSFTKAKKAYLTGSFNNWKPNAIEMIKTSSGWELPVYLSWGAHKYGYIIDGVYYPDPENIERLVDKTGRLVSVIHINSVFTSIEYYQAQLLIDEQLEDKFKIAVNSGNLGYAYLRSNNFENARKSFERALLLYEQLKIPDSIASLTFKIALCYKSLSDFPHLLEYIQKSIRAYTKAGNDYELARVYREMGYYYINLPHMANAPEYFYKALELYERLNKQPEKAKVLGDLGHMYLLMSDADKGSFYLQKALALNQQIGNKSGIANNLWLLGGYHFKNLSNIPAALDYYKKAQTLFEETGDKVKLAFVFFSLADLYRDAPDSALRAVDINISQRHILSIQFYKKGLDILERFQPESEQIIILLVLSEAYEKIKKFDSAFHFYKRYANLRERILSTEKQKDIIRYETKYEYQKKEDSLKLRQDLIDEKLQKQIELNQSQLALSNKEKDLQHLAFLKAQSDLENEKLVKQQKEKENQLQSAQVNSLTQKNEIIQLNQQRQWIYIIGGFVLLAIGSLYFIYRSRLRGVKLEAQLIKEKAEQEKKATEFQRKLADVSMSALRSQMNPHFIFNCLNSIKLYTTQNDSAAASEYLTKFSKLIRLILENSRSERINLSSELAALQLYIEMEAMRFKEKLSYSLSVDKNVESDYIEIPPLLLQPYVENAIWHGLMAREDGGHISITVAMQEDKSLLEINITDNGVGRDAAAALTKQIASKHRSYGMKATTERIALINQIYKTGAKVLVQDLINKKGQPEGTKVTIQIPV